MQEKTQKEFLVPAGKSGIPVAEGEAVDVLDNRGRLTGVWDFFRAQKRRKPPQITNEQAAEEFGKVGNNPLMPEAETVPLDEEFFSHLEKVPEEVLELLESPFTMDELNTALGTMPPDEAKDRQGLCMRMLSRHLLRGGRQHLSDLINEDSFTHHCRQWREKLHHCKNSSLYKNRGPANKAGNYRFTTVSAVIMKLCMRMWAERMKILLKKCGLVPGWQMGFEKGVGVQESLLVCSRLREDLDACDLECFLTSLMTVLGLAKAFPSADWRMARRVAQKMEILDTAMWKCLESSHRGAIYFHGSMRAQKEHGFKEGCGFSPDGFKLLFGAVMARYELRRREKGMSEGVTLKRVKERLPANRTETIKKMWWPTAGTMVLEQKLGSLLFADDTTIIEEALRAFAAELAAAVEEYQNATEEQRKGMTAPNTPCGELCVGVLNESGWNENLGKRVIGEVVRIATRNLGMNTNSAEDARIKAGKAWGAFNNLKKNISGVGILTYITKAQLIVVMCRSVSSFGLQSRGVTEGEFETFHKLEGHMLKDLLGVKFWKLQCFDENMADLRLRTKVVRFKTWMCYQKSKFFAHTMRRGGDSLAKRALMGRFFPSRVQGVPERHCFVNRNELGTTSTGARLRKASVLGNVTEWLDKKCLVPPATAYHVAQDKALFHCLTREACVRETIKDFSRAKKATPEKLEKLKKEMRSKHGLANANLDTHKTTFKKGHCFKCDKAHVESTITKHFEAFHRDFGHDPQAEGECKMFLDELKEEEERREERILKENEEKFRKTGAKGPKPKNRKRQKKFHCIACGINYATSVGAMVAHVGTHEAGLPIKIGKLFKGAYEGSCRPAEHQYNHSTDKLSFGSDARLHHIAIPQGMKGDGGKITCTKCGIYEVDYEEGMSLQQRALRAGRMSRHMERCAGKKKKRGKGKKKR